MNYISWLPLYFCPLNESEFNLTIKLSNNEEKIFPYYYFLNDTIYDIPISQDIFLYEWNYSTIGFRCRVDEENKLNVFYQNAFIFFELDENEMLDLLNKCSKLFHSNNYKIVGIESRNQGGLITLPTYLEQLIQPKICKNRVLASLRNNEYLESAFELYHNEFLDIKTCKPFKSFKNFLEEKPDDYGNSIKHYRTKISDIISIENKTDLNKKREELIKTKNTKKPTDIIIFTDYYSISATSIFLKGFQQTGGAIVVGYFGNPKIKNVTRDSSINSSGGFYYDHIIPFINLDKSGFWTFLTSFEIYNYDYQAENPIPQEYMSYPVDEHADIYEEYNESNYQKFMDEANKIFKKYETKCNKNNKLLLLEDNNCYNIEGDKHAHGGFVCGDNGEWDKMKCQAFYCDLGYYYDTYQQKCIEDLCTKTDDDNDDNNNENDDWVLIIIIIALSLSLLIIMIFIIFMFKKKSNLSIKNDDYKIMGND